MDWLLEQGKSAVTTYIDFKAAFGVPEKHAELVELMYKTASVMTRTVSKNGKYLYSRNISSEQGVLQGHIFNPLCFIAALDRIFRGATLLTLTFTSWNTQTASPDWTTQCSVHKKDYRNLEKQKNRKVDWKSRITRVLCRMW